MAFAIKVFGPVVIVTVTFPFTVTDRRRLRAEIDRAVERGSCEVRIDLSAMSNLGGETLGELQQLAQHVADRGGELRLMSVTAAVRRELQEANSDWLLRYSRGRKRP